jgi:hypothetical protein
LSNIFKREIHIPNPEENKFNLLLNKKLAMTSNNILQNQNLSHPSIVKTG